MRTKMMIRICLIFRYGSADKNGPSVLDVANLSAFQISTQGPPGARAMAM